MDKYVKSPIYYTGNKYKLLKKIIPLFPKKIQNFYDVFGGSGTVSINVGLLYPDALIHFNDLDYTYNLMKTLLSRSQEEEVERCEKLAIKYGFPNKDTWRDNLKHEDYLNFKEKFKQNLYIISKNNSDDILFWMHYIFSNKIEFKKNGFMDLSCGARLLKPKIYLEKLKSLHKVKNMNLYNLNFLQFLKMSFNKKEWTNDFVYLDPPYLASTRIRYSGWDTVLEEQLLKCLDIMLENNIKFGLSNSLEVRGNKNIFLEKWIEKNKEKIYVYYLDHNTTLGAGDKVSGIKNTNCEVYITNYKESNYE